jgi:2,4-dienoyl-CoA reductase-like NADH-dependent reductase (Old Yellow Enzyme family)
MLFRELRIRDITLRNRIVISPMWQYTGVEGMPTDWHLMHLGRFADGGAGLVFQEGTAVEWRGRGTYGDLGLWSDRFVEPMSRLASAIRDNGAVPGIQLMHAGRKARTRRPMDGRGPLERSADDPNWDAWHPIAPSPVPLREDLEPPIEMSQLDIHTVIEAFGTAAARADRAGYDALDLHAGHGYLLHEFLSPSTNRRTDSFGGSFDNRVRMLCQVVESVRETWPDTKPLFVRLSCIDGAGWEMPDTIRLVSRLLTLGVDVIDCSSGGVVGSPLRNGQELTYGYQVPLAEQIHRTTGAVTMAVGLIVHAEHAEQILTSGAADLIAVGREVLINPNWPLDCALKLDVDDPFSLTAKTSAFWLRQRARTVPKLRPSTLGMDQWCSNRRSADVESVTQHVVSQTQ